MKKNPPLTPSTQNLKEKNQGLECMFPPTHWLHVFFIFKIVGQHFWPRLMARGRD
jgi:hypothetical protein